MRLTFPYTSLALCALCAALLLLTRDCEATSLHPRGILHPQHETETWVPTPGKASFRRRLKVRFARSAADIPHERQEVIVDKLRGYRDDIRTRPNKTFRGCRLAVVRKDREHHFYGDPDDMTYELTVKYFRGRSNRSPYLGYKWFCPVFAPDHHLVVS